MRPRWKRCVDFTDNQLGEALGKAYVQKTFGAEGKERTLKMVHALETALGQDIDKLSWMTPATRKEALVKLKAITNKIGYPDKWRDYSSVEIKRDDAVGNGFRARRSSNSSGSWTRSANRWTAWNGSMTPPTVNAYYDPQMNNINFPAGILQPPFFDNSMDDAVNFGGIGMVIGHELTHGFDDEGRQFDPEGNLKDWWTAADAKEFKQRAACVDDEYSSFSVGAGSAHQRQADAGREYGGQRRHAGGADGAAEYDRQGREEDRRLHAGAALLPGVRADLVLQRARGSGTAAGADRPALAAGIPRERRGEEYAGVSEGIFVQSGAADGEGERLPGLVKQL